MDGGTTASPATELGKGGMALVLDLVSPVRPSLSLGLQGLLGLRCVTAAVAAGDAVVVTAGVAVPLWLSTHPPWLSCALFSQTHFVLY